MEDGPYYQAPVDKAIPGGSNLQIDPSAFMRYKDPGGLNGGAEGSQGSAKIDSKYSFGQDKPYPNAYNRPKPTPIVTPQVKRPEKKRPMTYVDRLKWLKKCASTKKNKFNKPSDQSTFKSNLERRKAFQNSKLNRTALANGNHSAIKNDRADISKVQSAPAKVPQYNLSKGAFLNKSKPDCGTPLEDYGDRYGPLQSSVTFKCRKCCCTSFESLEMLKVHQLQCSSQASTSESLELDPSAASNVAGGAANSRTTRQVVLCSACGNYYENWDLFLHMREVHRRHICLFCLGLFSHSDKLASHLVSKHNVQENYFKCNNDLVDKYTETFYLLCCKCELMFSSRDNYVLHECNQVVKYCSMCNSKGAHKADCPKNSKNRSNPNDLDYNKRFKKNFSNKSLYDSSLSIHPVNEFGLDKHPFAEGLLGGFDYRNGKDLADLASFEGLGINEFNSAYNIPDTKPEKLSGDNLAQLIEEIKNCVSNTSAAPVNPVENKDDKISPFLSQTAETESHLKVSNSSANNPMPSSQNKSDMVDVNDGTNRVPKLTVKVPKVTSDKESSEYTSDSEDSDKLTVDLSSNNDGQGHYFNQQPDADIAPAGDDIPIIELTLDQPLDKYPLKDLMQVLLNAAVFSCIYCNHARKIAVNGKQLGMHFISQHKFSATVNSITAEELLPETIITKIKSGLDDVQDVYINLNALNKPDADAKPFDQVYDCFQCYYVTSLHKDLYFHNRKMHQKTILLCIMCKSNFYTYSELICHLCPGTYVLNAEITFRCCVCDFDSIPSPFRLMVHLRKRHLACDVCLEVCSNQSKLSTHVWKHKLHHFCYRCGIAYRNKTDITKHLFWKHGTESVLCKKCLQKKWPHVYHFCIPPTSFTCDECSYTFTKAVYLKVHKRLHSGECPYLCKELNCTEKFISRKLLAKHAAKHLSLCYSDSEKNPVHHSEKTNSTGNNISVPGKSDSPTTATKSKKSRKNKSKDKDNLLLDVNLPELNLSESGSSDDSEPETAKAKSDGGETNQQNPADESQPKLDSTDNLKEAEPVAGIWDNFKLYQESLEKQTEKPHVPKHVCESDHDYFLIPTNDPDVEIVGEIKLKPDAPPRESPKKKKTIKKKSKLETNSSSSDSSSDSTSSCSGGTNCSCCSSSGTSSSSSSSSSSASLSRKRQNTPRKDSIGSQASAIDIMATEESPTLSTVKPEISIGESDLDSEESETDEEFYDKNPQKFANKLLNEKRNQLLQLSSVNNGAFMETSRPPTPENGERKKKLKMKKKKKERKSEMPIDDQIKVEDCANIPLEQSVPSKITISLQSSKMYEGMHSGDSFKSNSGALSDADSKRASKRRRVPNKFYGYSSDEEFMMKASHLPPKLEWRKEDLPSPSGMQADIPLELPRVPEIPAQCSEPVPPIKIIPKELTSDESDSDKESTLQIKNPYSPLEPEPEIVNKTPETTHSVIGAGIPFPRPAGAREAREGESVYCYCRCPYDEVSEMIACDADGCTIEWFHFECVGIMVPPKGKWYCPDCRLRVENVHK